MSAWSDGDRQRFQATQREARSVAELAVWKRRDVEIDPLERVQDRCECDLSFGPRQVRSQAVVGAPPEAERRRHSTDPV